LRIVDDDSGFVIVDAVVEGGSEGGLSIVGFC
jgi:hypothetical protein